MKNKFSVKWKSSSQTRKQRKYRFNAPLHLKAKLICSGLSKDLRKKYNKRSIPIRTKDNVKILKGKFYGKQGKITEIDRKRDKVYIENIQVSKKDGTKVNFPIKSCNLQVIELNLDDKKRIARLNKNSKVEKKEKEIK